MKSERLELKYKQMFMNDIYILKKALALIY